MQKFYPHGTVVAVKNEQTEEQCLVMIVGRIFKQPDSDEILDYMGFIHPFGYQGLDKAICFSESQIQKVVFMGYQDLLENEYADFLRIKLDEGI